MRIEPLMLAMMAALQFLLLAQALPANSLLA